MIAARDVRDLNHTEFDDMGFLRYHDILKKADDQYVAPRKNKQDTSINLGTIRDKDSSLVEYAMKHDFEPVAQVYDDSDDMMVDLAETGEDMVRKSLMLENDKEKQKLVARSMVAFGTALVQDLFVERWVIEKTMKKGFKAGMGSTAAEWTEKLVKQYDGCQAKLWDLRKCYFGDIRKFFMNGPQGQPYFFTVEYESYDVVKQIFGSWDRWINVPTTVVYTPEMQTATSWSSWWTLRPITQNYCEIVFYYDPIANEIGITINGVDMLPIMEKKTTAADGTEKTLVSGYPLTEVSPSGAIPFAKFDLEPMHDFSYSKAQPGKMRVLADVENMLMKLNLIMVKQKAKPTMGNKSGKNLDDAASEPGTIINDIRDGDLFPVLPNFQGMNQFDFSFFELVKKELSKNSIEDSWQGIGNTQQDETATQDMNNLKAATLKVAALFDGLISGRSQLYWLRTYNIIKNWTKPVDIRIDTFKKAIENKYRSITIPTHVDGGQKATKRIIFSKDTTMSSEDIHQKELHIKSGKKGKGSKIHPVLDEIPNSGGETRIAVLHPEQLASLKLNWFYTCVPVPNGNDPLAYMMFAKQIQDAATFFGPDSLNVKKLKHKFAGMTGQDFDTWFISEQELQQKQQQAQATAAASAGGAQGKPIPGQKPGGNPTIAGAASGALPAQGMAGAMK